MRAALVLGVASLVLSASAASAQVGYPGYNYYGATVPFPGYAGYGYAATAPLYDYAAPAYGYGAVAPGTAGTTVIIVTPGAPAYTAPPLGAAITTTHPAMAGATTGVPGIGVGAEVDIPCARSCGP
jgi:hypothetical protein